MKKFLEWLLQYNKAFTAFFGVPLITYLAQNLVDLLVTGGVILPETAVSDITGAVLWLISAAVGVAVYAVPNKKK